MLKTGKHGSTRVLVSELRSPDDDTMDEPIPCDEVDKKTRRSVRSPSRMTQNSTSKTSVYNLLLLDVCPLGLGIEDIYGNMHTLIRRNTVIPTQTELFPIFTNAYADQTTATICIFEGEHNLTKYNVRSILTE